MWDEMQESFRVNYQQNSTVPAVVRNVNNVLNVPEDEVYRNKLATSIQLQVDIIDICQRNSHPTVYKNHPNMRVNVGRLVRLQNSRDEHGFKEMP